MDHERAPWVLATDVDNTLTGDRAALQELRGRLHVLREQGALFLILATGRRLTQVLHGFAHEGLPMADAVVSQVGTEIYLPPFKADMAPLAAWDERLRRSYSRRRALAFVQGIQGARLQADMYNTPLKASFYLDQAPDADGAAEAVRQRIAAAGAGDDYRVVWSSGRDLDIIPALAGKANAVRYLMQFLEMDADKVVAAGDSGNDLSMLTAFPRGIVVGNAQRELQQLRDTGRDGLFFAKAYYAAGVAQGLRHFGILRTKDGDRGEA